MTSSSPASFRPTPVRRPAPQGLPLFALFVVVLLTAAAPSVRAQSAADRMDQRVDTRQARQDERIDRGVQDGSLTPREARRLAHHQTRIDRAENRAMADGGLDRREAVRLERRQDAASRQIRRQKHDGQARP